MSDPVGPDPRKHQIVQVIMQNLSKGENERYALDDAAIAEIRTCLLGYGGRGLVDATIAVGAFAQYLVAHTKSTKCAIRLANEVALMAAPGIKAHLAASGMGSEAVRKQARKFTKFQQR